MPGLDFGRSGVGFEVFFIVTSDFTFLDLDLFLKILKPQHEGFDAVCFLGFEGIPVFFEILTNLPVFDFYAGDKNLWVKVQVSDLDLLILELIHFIHFIGTDQQPDPDQFLKFSYLQFFP